MKQQLYYCTVRKRGVAAHEYCGCGHHSRPEQHQEINNWCPRCGGVDTREVCCDGPTFGATLQFPCSWCDETMEVVWLATYSPGWKGSPGISHSHQELNPRCEPEHTKCREERIELQRNIVEKAKAAIANFPARSGNERLAKIILEAVGVAGATIHFFTGGDDSEPEGAVIKAPRRVYAEVYEATHLVDWSKVCFDSYQRYRDYPSFGGTPTYRLNEMGEVVS